MDLLQGLFQGAQDPIGVPTNDLYAQPKHLNQLAEESFARYTQTQSLAELEKTIELYQQTIECTPRSDVISRSGLLSNLSQRFHDRYDRTKMSSDLDKAFQAIQQALEVYHPQRGAMLSTLGCFLADKYEHTREAMHLEEAVRVSRQAVACTPETHPDRPTVLCNLGNRLGQKYSQSGHDADMEEAVQTLRAARASIPNTHTNQAAILRNLATQLGERYSSTGNIPDLDEAIVLSQEAVNHTRNSDLSRTQRMSTLSDLLYLRFNRTGGMSDLDEAIQLQKKAIHAISKHNIDQPELLHSLAMLMLARYSRSKAFPDVEEAIRLAKEADNNTPNNHVNKAATLNSLAISLATKASSTMEEADQTEAILVLRQVLQGLGHNRPERVQYLHNLAKMLGDKFAQSKTKTSADLEEVIEVAQQAVDAAPSDYPDRASLLSNLGTYLAESCSWTEMSTSSAKAKDCFISALHHTPSSMQSRIIAGRRLLLFTAILEDLDRAYDAASYTVDLIPLLISSPLQNIDKQALLSQAVAIASDAAAIALLHNKGACRAVELLEIGRNVITGSMQDLRGELFMLQEKHPDLVSRFAHLRQQVDVPKAQDNITRSDTSKAGFPEHDRQAEDQYSTLLGEIRKQPGFEDFLVARSAADMQAAAKDGPIVIINLSNYRCDALVIETSGFRTVPLPAISWDTIQDHECDSVETLEWLWDDIVLPVLNALGFTQQPSDDHWPHIWWIPTGRLVGYPLHAAGYHMGQNAETALDRVVSSYSSSVKTIIHSRRQQGYKPQEMRVNKDLVLVSMKTTPKHDYLKHSAQEIQAIREVMESSRILSPTEPLRFKKDVLSALASCSIFHFAGHGGTDLNNPLQSLLLLSDWQDNPLTMESVLETNLGREMPFLAYLSACGTGEIKAVSFVDESIHLAAAFQLSGFQHVIGTLWGVDDQLCVEMARMTYEGLLEGGMRDEAVSRSLHRATCELRDRWVNDELGQESRERKGWLRKIFGFEDTSELKPKWVPYVHYGI
ncbi:hypothetical protein ACHAP5_011260 [Fusarium lateritium]